MPMTQWFTQSGVSYGERECERDVSAAVSCKTRRAETDLRSSGRQNNIREWRAAEVEAHSKRDTKQREERWNEFVDGFPRWKEQRQEQRKERQEQWREQWRPTGRGVDVREEPRQVDARTSSQVQQGALPTILQGGLATAAKVVADAPSKSVQASTLSDEEVKTNNVFTIFTTENMTFAQKIDLIKVLTRQCPCDQNHQKVDKSTKIGCPFCKDDTLIKAAAQGDLQRMRTVLGDPDLKFEPDAVTVVGRFLRDSVVAQIPGGIIETAPLHNQCVEQANAFGGTALFAAALKNRASVVDFLLKKGANVEAKTKFGWTPLFAACANGHLDIVKLLVEQGHANIDFQSELVGATALYIASRCGHFDVVRYLVAERGADRKLTTKDIVDLKDKDGHVHPHKTVVWTPLEVARHHGHTRIVQFLKTHFSVCQSLKHFFK